MVRAHPGAIHFFPQFFMTFFFNFQVRKRKMVRARKKKKATINRINRLILKIILPTTNYNTNKKHITTSIYDKNENFCFSRKIIWSFSQRRLWKKKKPRIQVAFVYYNSIKTAVHHMCVSLKDDFGIRHFSRKFFRHHQQEKKWKRAT